MFLLGGQSSCNSSFISFVPGLLRYSYDTKQGSKRSMGEGAAVGRRQKGQGKGGLGSSSRKGDTVVAADD